jgi:tripartite-type tricarboxylate transporter receptor subunit TctC
MTITRRSALALTTAFAAAAFAAAVGAARAQDFPHRQVIRIVVPQAAGSATDVIARLLAGKMAVELGQQIIVDNRAGAGGVLGAEAAAKSPADGYTLFLANISTHGVNPGLYKKLQYDPIGDFAPIGMAGGTSNILIVNADLPIRTLRELIDHAKANPGKLTFATPGPGSSQHLATELFLMMAGRLDMLHVPFRGSPPGVTGVMTGVVHWMMPATPSARAAIQSGKVRPIAVTSGKRHADYPDVPTIGETLPGYDVTAWYGLAAPSGTPQPIVAALNSVMRKALSDPTTVKSLAAAGMEPATSTPEAFGDFIKAEIERWTRIARDANIKLD